MFEDEEQDKRSEVIHRVQLKNQHHQVFYDKLTFIYLTLPNFTKTLDELKTLHAFAALGVERLVFSRRDCRSDPAAVSGPAWPGSVRFRVWACAAPVGVH